MAKLTADALYMKRCFELARLAGNNVKSNPNVGSLVVWNNTVIGEGYHQYYGGLHAERNAILNIKEKDRPKLKEATLYVSLEPCNIHGKTPPCTDIILESEIPKIVVSVKDPNPKMQGKSLQYLKAKGIEVIDGILEKEGSELIKPFLSNLQNRPYVMLKFAQSSDAYFGKRNKQVWLTNEHSKRKVHLWRSQFDAILIGYNTALIDNPQLTTRLVPGNSPVRVVLDDMLSLPQSHYLWSDDHPTIFITQKEETTSKPHKSIVVLEKDDDYLTSILQYLYKKGICRLMVEGGANTLNAFIIKQLWDEARIISTSIALGSGIRAPQIKDKKYRTEVISDNRIDYIYRS